MKITMRFFCCCLLLNILIFTLSSCAVTKVKYVPMHKIEIIKKAPNTVELLACRPNRNAFCIGLIGTGGNGYASHEDGVKEAKTKAAQMGADFIVIERSGTEAATHINPGYSTYSGNGTVSSVGPTATTLFYPWGQYSAWIYTPSRSGIDLDENNYVIGFHLQSNADEVGVKVGDKVIGVDGIDIKDERLAQHMMGVSPGDSLVITVLRDDKRIKFTITALPN